MSPDYYNLISRGPAKHPNVQPQLDKISYGTFLATLLLPIIIHFSDDICFYLRTISLTTFRGVKTTLRTFYGLCEILVLLRRQQSTEGTTPKITKPRKYKTQATPPSDVRLQLAIHQVQLTSTTEPIEDTDFAQATVNIQPPSLHTATTISTAVSQPPVATSDRAFSEFTKDEERYSKFINQDLTFLQQPHTIQTTDPIEQTSDSQHRNSDQKRQIILPQTQDTQDLQVNPVEPTLGITLHQYHQLRDNPDIPSEEILETQPIKDYADTPIKTLDGIVVQQPKRFLPLAQEAKRIAQEIRKEEIAAQWAGIPPEKLLDHSFAAQLTQLQTLSQIAPLHEAKDQLPNDIIDILHMLGKCDNVPTSQLYILADRCADRYYTQVITAFVELFKRHLVDRQTILINSARALKYLEQYTNRQTNLWKVLSKYDDIPDHFQDLKQTLTQEFQYLKQATSLNIQNITQRLAAQETYLSTLTSHISVLYARTSQLNSLITQGHMSSNDIDTDYVELSCPDFDPDLDPIQEATSHAQPTEEEGTTPTGGFDTENTNRPNHQPDQVQRDIPTNTSFSQEDNIQQGPDQRPISQGNDQPTSLEDQIPPLIDDSEVEEDWENGQFLDAEADHTLRETIRNDYSASFLKESPALPEGHYHSATPQTIYVLPDAEYQQPRRRQYTPREHHVYTGDTYLPPTPSGADIRAWETGPYGRGRARRLELHKNRPFGEKTRSKEARIARKKKKNLRDRQKKAYDQYY